jgi:hypothetical protein
MVLEQQLLHRLKRAATLTDISCPRSGIAESSWERRHLAGVSLFTLCGTNRCEMGEDAGWKAVLSGHSITR